MDPADVQKLLKHSEQIAPFEGVYSIYMYFMFVLSSLLTYISLYLFLNRQTNLYPELREITAHTMIASYAMTSTMTLWQVIVLPPYVGGYPLGWLFKTIGPYCFLFGLWISCVIHLGISYTLAYSLQCYRMKIAGRENCLGRIFKWFLEGKNTTLFLRLSVLFNFAFAAIPISSLAWFTVPIENEPLLDKIRTQHPEIILIVIRENYVFLGSVLICALIISVEISYCLKTNWSTFMLVRKTRKIVTQKTRAMQLHMYRLFSIQLLTICIFYYVPTLLACLHMFEVIDLKNVCTLNITFMVWHSSVQTLISLLGYPRIREKIVTIGSSKLSKLSGNSMLSG